MNSTTSDKLKLISELIARVRTANKLKPHSEYVIFSIKRIIYDSRQSYDQKVDDIYGYRASGRTTEMLLRASACLLLNENVILLSHSEIYTKALKIRLVKMVSTTIGSCNHSMIKIPDNHVELFRKRFNGLSEELGILEKRYKAQSFIDHHFWDYKR